MKKSFLSVLVIMFMATGALAANRGEPRNDFITKTGDYMQFAIPLSALFFSIGKEDWQGVQQFGLAVGSTAATTHVLKYITNEERPYQAEDTDGRTFPSGHTSFAFSGAAYWQRRYGWYIGAPMYAAASFVGYSRVHARMHNWFDVGTAAALGIGFNLLFTSRYVPAGTQVTVEPVDDGAMLRFNTTF